MAVPVRLRLARALPVITGTCGIVVFLATGVAEQIAHPYRIATTPFSAYLKGPGSAWLQSAYYLLTVGLWSLAAVFAGWWPAIRGFATAGLLVIAGAAVALVAYTYSPWPLPGPPSMAMRVEMHIMSAFVAFLSVTVVMFMATPMLWRKRGVCLGVLILCGLVLAIEIAAGLAPSYLQGTYGALEKCSIAGLILWLFAAALRLIQLGGRQEAVNPK